MSLVDPNKLTVAKLKSALSENGFSDRLHGQKLKADYVQLYKELVVPKLKEKESEEENKEKRKKRGNEENLKENSQEDPPVRRSSRRQTLASLPRAPMTPLATASTPKRVAKRSSSRQSMLPAKRKNIELEEESQEEVHENVELKKEQVEGDVEESSSEDSKDAEEQDKLIELLPPEIPPTVLAPSTPIKLAGFEGITPITSPHQSLLYLRQRKKFKGEEEEESQEASVQQSESGKKEEEKEQEEEKEKEKDEGEKKKEETQTESKQESTPIEEVREVPASVPPKAESAEVVVESTPAARTSRRRVIVKQRRSATTATTATPATPSTRSRFLGPTMILLELVLAVGLIIFFFPSLLDVSPMFTVEREIVPFCDTASFSAADGSPCLRCPTNGNCNGGKVTCYPAHVFRDGACVQDESYLQSALALKDTAYTLLNERAGCHQCGYSGIDTPYLTEGELRQQLEDLTTYKALGPQQQQPHDGKFSLVFDLMHKEVVDHPEWGISVRTDDVEGKRMTTWVVKEPSLPLACTLQMFLMAHLWEALLALVAAVVIPWIWWRRRCAALEHAEVDALVEEVKGLLVAQRQRAEEDEQLRTMAWVPLTHIRDTLFHDDPSRKKRFMPNSGGVGQAANVAGQKRWLRIWDKVISAVSTDRRILTSPQMFEGEQVATWEWVSLVPSTARSSGFMSPIKQRRQQSMVEARSVVVQQEEEYAEAPLGAEQEDNVNNAAGGSIYPTLLH